MHSMQGLPFEKGRFYQHTHTYQQMHMPLSSALWHPPLPGILVVVCA